MITIIDYGLGNIKAFANVYKRLNIPIVIADTANKLKSASKIILPGVGAFDHAMTLLNNSGMRETLDDMVLNKKTPVIGICVGMQILAKSSEEGTLPGLGWIDAHVKHFNSSGIKIPLLPHMGWNSILPSENNLFHKIEKDARFYFLHSYYFDCNDKKNIIAQANYHVNFTCSVNKNNIFGVQFHPEKSHNNGIQLLNNFAKLQVC